MSLFQVINRSPNMMPLPLDEEWVLWRTCLRQMAIGYTDSILPRATPNQDEQIYVGREAYVFLCEVISGLHSPLIGETEVFGQFKQFVSELELQNNSSELLQWVKHAINDVKVVREQFLRGVGGQSYGSLVRKEIRGGGAIHCIGAGHLMQEIYPWLSKENKAVFVWARNPEKARNRFSAHVQVQSLEKAQGLTGTLIVAAPVSAQWLNNWLINTESRVQKVIDLRGESQSDPLTMAEPVIDLQKFFALLEENKSQTKEKVENARQLILSLAEQRAKVARIRPQGWEDLCL